MDKEKKIAEAKKTLLKALKALKAAAKTKGYYNPGPFYLAIIEVFMELGDTKESLRIASEMPDELVTWAVTEDGNIYSNSAKSDAYVSVAKALLDGGDTEEVFNVTSEITNSAIKAITCANISKLLTERGRKTASKQLLSESLSVSSMIFKEKATTLWANNYLIYIYLYLSKSYMELGELKEAKQTLLESMHLATDIAEANGIMPLQHKDSAAYDAISKALMELGDNKESLRIASEIPDDKIKAINYANLSSLLLARGEKLEAKRVLSESLIMVSNITDIHTKVLTYAAVSRVLWDADLKEDSKNALLESLHLVSSEKLVPGSKSKYYGILSKIFLEIGEDEEVIRIVEKWEQSASEITRNDCYDSYLKISKVLMQLGKKEEANEMLLKSLSIVSKISSKHPMNDNVAIGLGQMQISKRFMELGDKEEAVRIASNIASDAHKAEAFVEISKVLMQLGKKEESKQALLESLSSADLFMGFGNIDHVYVNISKLFMELGDKDESLRMIKEIKDKWNKSQAYVNLSKIGIEGI